MWLQCSFGRATCPSARLCQASRIRALSWSRIPQQESPREPALARRHRWACPVVAMAKPRKKAPEKTVKIYCTNCRAFLYKYRKGGNGALVKCFHERIVEDATDGKLQCPGCGQDFARETMIRGAPANKMIGGKVRMQK